MPDTNQLYENKLKQNIVKTNRAIKRIYEKSINEIIVNISSIRYKNIPFSLKDYPALKNRIDAAIKKMHASMYTVVVNSIEDSWGLANQKNNILIDKRLAGKRALKSVRKVIYDPNKKALDSFINRKDKGLNLSQRIWNTLEPFKSEMEQTLGFAISKGESAATTASTIKKYLNEPDKLFRRVRSAEGKLVLSPAARNYHPGQGIYRSSYKNALRVTRTENNIAYRSADYERWQTLPFVIGIEIKLSNAHPRFDICDHLTGTYPKEFKFTGWHPQCICYATPKMSSDDDFEKMEDAILSGKPIQSNSIVTVSRPPAAFNKWLSDNKERVANLKNKPYWIKDNKKFIQ